MRTSLKKEFKEFIKDLNKIKNIPEDKYFETCYSMLIESYNTNVEMDELIAEIIKNKKTISDDFIVKLLSIPFVNKEKIANDKRVLKRLKNRDAMILLLKL